MTGQPLGAGVVHRLRRPGRIGQLSRTHAPGDLGARSIRFAAALTPSSLPHAEPVTTGRVPGQTLAGAIRVEVPVHRLAQVQAAGSMIVPRDLLPLQNPVASQPRS
ncbi:MAG TPA: hypothetical protein VLL08_20815 [Kineosporiaceae bacterium]|nr:hypothetical protein [Kineosporiaceae bacterium]